LVPLALPQGNLKFFGPLIKPPKTFLGLPFNGCLKVKVKREFPKPTQMYPNGPQPLNPKDPFGKRKFLNKKFPPN